MNEITKNTIGSIGGILLVITLIPQIYQTYKTKKIRDVSIWFLILEIITCLFFFTYGIALKEYPLIIANSLVLIELFILLFAKKIFKDVNIKNNRITITSV